MIDLISTLSLFESVPEPTRNPTSRNLCTIYKLGKSGSGSRVLNRGITPPHHVGSLVGNHRSTGGFDTDYIAHAFDL